MPQLQPILFMGVGFLLAVILFYFVQIAKRMRELLAVKLKRCALGLALYMASTALGVDHGFAPTEAAVIGFLVSMLAFWFIRAPRRSRHVPPRIKRALVTRDLPDEQYDSSRHHFDHIVPLSKGGDNSARNLRVISKEANLKKGARMPRLKDFL